MESKDTNRILETGDALLEFYAQFPINEDIAGNSFNVYKYRAENAIFERRGDYTAARENLKKLLYVLDYISDDIAAFRTYEAMLRKLDTHTEVYALTGQETARLHYGAKHEPTSGVYLGRVIGFSKGVMSKGAASEQESILAMYVEVGGETAGTFDWQAKVAVDGNKALLVSFNFPKEGDTVWQINEGWHESNIRTTLEYLATLEVPVFLRIGGEMNIWTVPTTPDAFKSAYIYIAKMARSIAPNVALIFSPNAVTQYNSPYDMEDYYPGDAYVDWVGMSLYYNSSVAGTESTDFNNAYYGTADWAEPVACAAEVVEKFGDRKPIMITEGGSSYYNEATGERLTAFAAECVARAYRTVTMVYPQIKAILYFDNDFGGSSTGAHYLLSQNKTVQNAYDNATAANETYLHDRDGSALTYAALDGFYTKADRILLSAYAYAHYCDKIFVRYSLDGTELQTGTGITHDCVLEVAALSVGTHTLSALFTNGAGYNETRTYHLVKDASGIVAFADAKKDAPTVTDAMRAVPAENDLPIDTVVALGIEGEKIHSFSLDNIDFGIFGNIWGLVKALAIAICALLLLRWLKKKIFR